MAIRRSFDSQHSIQSDNGDKLDNKISAKDYKPFDPDRQRAKLEDAKNIDNLKIDVNEIGSGKRTEKHSHFPNHVNILVQEFNKALDGLKADKLLLPPDMIKTLHQFRKDVIKEARAATQGDESSRDCLNTFISKFKDFIKQKEIFWSVNIKRYIERIEASHNAIAKTREINGDSSRRVMAKLEAEHNTHYEEVQELLQLDTDDPAVQQEWLKKDFDKDKAVGEYKEYAILLENIELKQLEHQTQEYKKYTYDKQIIATKYNSFEFHLAANKTIPADKKQFFLNLASEADHRLHSDFMQWARAEADGDDQNTQKAREEYEGSLQNIKQLTKMVQSYAEINITEIDIQEDIPQIESGRQAARNHYLPEFLDIRHGKRPPDIAENTILAFNHTVQRLKEFQGLFPPNERRGFNTSLGKDRNRLLTAAQDAMYNYGKDSGRNNSRREQGIKELSRLSKKLECVNYSIDSKVSIWRQNQKKYSYQFKTSTDFFIKIMKTMDINTANLKDLSIRFKKQSEDARKYLSLFGKINPQTWLMQDLDPSQIAGKCEEIAQALEDNNLELYKLKKPDYADDYTALPHHIKSLRDTFVKAKDVLDRVKEKNDRITKQGHSLTIHLGNTYLPFSSGYQRLASQLDMEHYKSYLAFYEYMITAINYEPTQRAANKYDNCINQLMEATKQINDIDRSVDRFMAKKHISGSSDRQQEVRGPNIQEIHDPSKDPKKWEQQEIINIKNIIEDLKEHYNKFNNIKLRESIKYKEKHWMYGTMTEQTLEKGTALTPKAIKLMVHKLWKCFGEMQANPTAEDAKKKFEEVRDVILEWDEQLKKALGNQPSGSGSGNEEVTAQEIPHSNGQQRGDKITSEQRQMAQDFLAQEIHYWDEVD